MYKKAKEPFASPVNGSPVVTLIAIGDVTDFFAITSFAFSSKMPTTIRLCNVYRTSSAFSVKSRCSSSSYRLDTKCQGLLSSILEVLIFSPKHRITSFVCNNVLKELLKNI